MDLTKKFKKFKANYDKRSTKVFDKKTGVAVLSLVVLAKSLPFAWIVSDAILSWKLYKKQSQQEHALRWARLGVGITWFTGVLNPTVAGFLLVVDGIYSIFRYRRYKITKSFVEDVPRLARIGVGFIIMAALPLTLPSMGIL